MKGKLIVLEGTDGSGKGTQLALLVRHLQNKNIPFATLDFPRYSGSFFGDLAGKMLMGELGPVEHIPPKLAVLPFACDRWLTKKDLNTWLSEKKIIISNRYTASSAVYHAARLAEGEQRSFIDWVLKLEQEIIGMPAPDITLFFHVPVAVSQQLMEKRGTKKDMYEKNLGMLQIVEELYGRLGSRSANWRIIECTRERLMRSREEIHKEVLDVLTQNGIL